MGYCEGDFRGRPVIGIANSWNTLVPGHFNLNMVSEHVKKGIHRAGGGRRFGVIASCDGVCEGYRGCTSSSPSGRLLPTPSSW